MRYCLNCKQDVAPRRNTEGWKKAVMIVGPVFLFFFGCMFSLGTKAGNDLQGYVWGEYAPMIIGGLAMIAASFVLPAVAYSRTPKTCPICNAGAWGQAPGDH